VRRGGGVLLLREGVREGKGGGRGKKGKEGRGEKREGKGTWKEGRVGCVMAFGGIDRGRPCRPTPLEPCTPSLCTESCMRQRCNELSRINGVQVQIRELFFPVANFYTAISCMHATKYVPPIDNSHLGNTILFFRYS